MMKKVGRILLIVIVIAIFIGTIMFLYQKSQDQPVEYAIEQATTTTIVDKTIATGSVVPRKEIAIKPQAVSGIIEKLYVVAGERIKKGDPIAKVKIIPDMINLNSATSRVESAKINFENAKINYNRDKELYQKKVIATVDFQKTELTYRSAKQELNTAEDNLQLIKEGVTKNAKNATNTIVRSTIDGMILDIPLKEGNSVIQSNNFNDGTTIAVVADMGQMIFKGKVDETEVGKIKVGMPLELTIGAIEGVKFKAVLEYISPKGVEANGAVQFEIKAAIELNSKYFIRSGYSANAEVVLEKRENVLAINESLLEFKNDSTFVMVQTSPQKFKRKYVKTGLSDGIMIEVLDGITKNDKLRGKKKSKIEQIQQQGNNEPDDEEEE